MNGKRGPSHHHLFSIYVRGPITWRQFAGWLRRAAEGQQDVSEVSIALRINNNPPITPASIPVVNYRARIASPSILTKRETFAIADIWPVKRRV